MSYTDSRNLLAELRDLLSDPTYDYDDDPPADALSELDTDDQERVETLRGVLLELPETTVDSTRGNSWGCTLIPKDDFEDYAKQYASDIGAIDDDASWPCTCIDWERAAAQLSMDYVEVELDGRTYLVR